MANCWSLQPRTTGLGLWIQPFIFCHLCHCRQVRLKSAEPRLQAFVKIQMTRNQTNTFQNRRIFRESYFSRAAIKVNKTDTRLNVFVAS